MIFDAQSLLSDAQAVTASAASTNVIDFGAAGTAYRCAAPLPRDQGKGEEIPLRIQVVETFATLTSLTIAVQVSADAAFTSPRVVATTGAIAAADLVAGWVSSIDDVPVGTTERYMRLYYTVAGSAATAGRITAGVTCGNQTA